LPKSVKGATLSFAETVDRAGSGSEEIFDGFTGSVGKPQPVIATVDDPIPADQDALQAVVGQNKLNSSDAAIFQDDEGLSRSFTADEAASDSEEESLSDSLAGNVAAPTRTALDGNVQAERATFSTGNNSEFGAGGNSDSVAAMLNRDDNFTFMMFPPG
jgi:hypothetical protein